MPSPSTIALVLAMFTVGACSHPGRHAVATFTALGGSTIVGGATFTERDGTTLVRVEAHHIAPGGHGVHVHDVGDCSSPDGASAGDHFNPDGTAHGHGAAPASHADHAESHQSHHGDHDQHAGHAGHSGDLGNLEADTNGSGVLLVETDQLTVADGPRSVVGRSIVIHAHEDDLITQPGGGSGDRIGCGVIRRE